MTDILNTIMKSKPVLSKQEKKDIASVMVALSKGEDCTLSMDADFSTAVAIVLVAGLEALDE